MTVIYLFLHIYVLPVEQIQNFHCIKVFSGYTAFSTLMATSVTLTDFTDWSLVKISIKTVKFWLRGQLKSSPSKNLPKYSFIFR